MTGGPVIEGVVRAHPTRSIPSGWLVSLGPSGRVTECRWPDRSPRTIDARPAYGAHPSRATFAPARPVDAAPDRGTEHQKPRNEAQRTPAPSHRADRPPDCHSSPYPRLSLLSAALRGPPPHRGVPLPDHLDDGRRRVDHARSAPVDPRLAASEPAYRSPVL